MTKIAIARRGVVRRSAAVLLAGLFLFVAAFAPAVSNRAGAATATHHKKNWVQRHPTLTAIGAGVVTHHALKVAAKNAKAHGKKLNWAERHPTLSAVGVGVVTHHEIKKHTPK
jgi:hypothetical protein